MVFFNWATMQMAAKIVYYGPGLCGKTSNLSYIYAKTSPKSRGEMVSLETESDRTLFFDLLPIEVGTIGGFKTRLQLYTVPGQVFYNTTRKLVLKGVDGLVFVADSQRPMREANVESFKSLVENIEELGLSIDELPLVLQFNKRDLDNILTEEELNSDLNPDDTYPWHPASAINGEGVFETLKEITKLTLKKLRTRMAAPQADASPRPPLGSPPAAPAPPPAEEPPPPKAAAPISASSLARAAEEGAGDGFPVPPAIKATAEDSPESQVSEPHPGDEAKLAPVSEEPEMLEAEEPGSSPDETTASSIPEFPADEPFAEPGAEDVAEEVPSEDLEPIEEDDDHREEPDRKVDGDEMEDDVVEFDTGVDEPVAVVPPPVKRVHVSSESDILAQLDDLRRHATETTPSRPRGAEKELDLDALLGSDSERTRDLKRRIEHRLNSNLFQRMRSMQIAFRIQDSKGDVVHTLDPVSIAIGDASSLEKLILQLTIDLENLP